MNKNEIVRVRWILVMVLLLVGCGSNLATETLTMPPLEDEVEATTEPTDEARVETPEETAGATATDVPTPTVFPTATEISSEAMSGPPAVEGPRTPVVVYTRKEAADREGSLWVWRPDHAPSMLTSGGSEIRTVTASDDGEVVVFVRVTLDAVFSESASLWAVNTDGTNERLLLSAEDLAEIALDPEAYGSIPNVMVFVPGTHALLFTTRVLVERPGTNQQIDLWRIDADTGWLSPLVEGDPESYQLLQNAFVISPDGTQVAVVTREMIEVISTDGRTQTGSLLDYEAAPVSSYSLLAEVGWTADNQTLLVALPPSDVFDDTLPTTMLRIPIDGSPIETLPEKYGLGLFQPFFNGDGSAYAYFGVVPDEGDDPLWGLREATENGSNDRLVLAEQSMRFIGWDPDNVRYTARLLQRTMPNAFIGALGREMLPLENVMVNDDDHIGNSLRWINAQQLVYVGYIPGSSSVYGLLSVTPGEQPIFVGEIGGDRTIFFPQVAVIP